MEKPCYSEQGTPSKKTLIVSDLGRPQIPCEPRKLPLNPLKKQKQKTTEELPLNPLKSKKQKTNWKLPQKPKQSKRNTEIAGSSPKTLNKARPEEPKGTVDGSESPAR